MAILGIVVGTITLLLGRQLFWLAVAGIGFLLGISLVPVLFPNQPDDVQLLLAIALGLLGALLAFGAQKLAVAIAGIIGGGLLLYNLLQLFNLDLGLTGWILILIGAIIGGLLAFFVFEWTLIILSSLAGAAIILDSIALRPLFEAVLFVLLVAVGVGVQLYLYQGRGRAASGS